MTCPISVTELATVEGEQPNTAIRVRLVTQGDGSHVVLEHRAYTADLGWYTQKSFRLPTAVLPALATQFRFADALARSAPTPPASATTQIEDTGPIPFPGPPMQQPRQTSRRRRRDA